MLSFACGRFDGVVPDPGELDGEDRELLAEVEAGFETVGELYNGCKFRAALGAALVLAREANGYTFAPLSAGRDRKAPWFQIKRDRQAAATTVYVILRVVDTRRRSWGASGRTRRSGCTSIWATRGSCSGRSTWPSSRRKPAPTRRSPTITAGPSAPGRRVSCRPVRPCCASLRPSSGSWTRV